MSWLILHGDARRIPLTDESVQCVVTSPPYWGLRDYKLGANSLGLEPTPELYVQHLVEIFRELRRVLRKDGTVWLNMGDSYASQGHTANDGDKKNPHLTGGGLRSWGEHRQAVMRTSGISNLKPKDLCGLPWRVAFVLQTDGWWLRSDIIWAKPNPMPESVTDRPTRSHEYVFLLTKSERYYYDQEGVKESLASDPKSWGRHSKKDPGMQAVNSRPMFGPNRDGRDGTEWGDGHHRNLRSVWTIATQPFPDAHFATFPEKLVEPCIKAGTSEKGCCAGCGAPWERVIEKKSFGKKDYNVIVRLT